MRDGRRLYASHVLERWTRVVLRFRLAVLVVWLLVLVFGTWAATRLPGLLSNSFAVPGTDSDRAETILMRHFGERAEGSFTVVFRTPRPNDPATRASLTRRLRRVARMVPTAHVGPLLAGGGIAYATVETALDLTHAKRYTDRLRHGLAVERGPPVIVTGQPAIQRDLDPVFSSDLRNGEKIALPLALLILLAVFGISFAVVIPFAFAACTITGTLAIVYGLAHELSIVSYVTNLVGLIGLALAIDYSLLIGLRFREEIERGGKTEEAIVRTMATAGRAVVFSGLAVAAGLAMLLLIPVPFIRAMGVGGLLIPLVSILGAVTLQPALLSLAGRRGVRNITPRMLAAEVESGFWSRLARAIMRRPIVFLAAGTAVLVVVATPALFLQVTPASPSAVPQSLESIRGFNLLVNRVAAGAPTPIEIVVDSNAGAGALRRPVRSAIDRLSDDLVRDPEAYIVAKGTKPPYVDRTGRYTRLIVLNRHVYSEQKTLDLVRRLSERWVPAAHFPTDAEVYVGGVPAQGRDYLTRTYGRFPWLVTGALVLEFLILLRAFRSLLIPLKAVVLNALTVAAAYGAVVVVFGSPDATQAIGLYRAEHIEGWIPVFLFAVLFGVSIDYEIFLVMRMRESWERVPDNARAVVHGLERTGRMITAAALIMVVAFSGFLAGDIGALQQFGLGLTVAVILDATIVRGVLVPSLMAVFGKYNWWLPGQMRGVPADHSRAAPPRGTFTSGR
jgi:putative drug exporter of the RND superfamily